MYSATPYALTFYFKIILALFSQNNLKVHDFNISNQKTIAYIFELLIYVDDVNVVRMYSKYYEDAVIILVLIHPYIAI